VNLYELLLKNYLIKYVCGHKKLGIDTMQASVTKNEVKCPKCNDMGGDYELSSL